MSRVGRRPIPVPEGVEVTIQNSRVSVKGPKGELTGSFHPDLSIHLAEGVLSVSRPSDQRRHRSLHGLTRTLLANMVEGVSAGFRKNLELVGVGYRAQQVGEKVVLQVGYSHPVEWTPPTGVSLAVEGTNRISVTGIDKQLVGEVASQIRRVRPPEPYKGKGIRYAGEVVLRKAGKSGRLGRA